MRILIVGLNFYPELTGIGKYTGEMAAFLSSQGHQVRVVTTPPYYPHWRVQPGYRGWQYKHETWSGVEVYRCPLWVPRKPSGAKRILHLLSFALSSLPVLLAQVFWRPGVVLCVAPSFLSAPFALLTAKLSGARSWLHVQDFELDAATRLGMLGHAASLSHWAAAVTNRLFRTFDRISTISNRMLVSLEQKGVPAERTALFPNWVNIQEIFPLPAGPDMLREEFGIPRNKIVVLYSGNMGVKQGLEFLLEAAQRLQKNPAIHFVLCGEGSARADLELAAGNLRNVQILPLQPPEALNRLLNSADIHVLPQRADAADLVMPSKLLGMLASGKAVIATADRRTEIGKLVGQVGVLVPPGDLSAFCKIVLELGISTNLRESLGQKGRAYVCKNWSTERVLGKFERQLRKLCAKQPKIVKNSLPIKR